MKKTLFLTAILGLSSMGAAAAGYDAMRPQEIITVEAGETLRATDAGFLVDLSQMNQGITTDNRTAIMKDGQGTFVLDKSQDMFCSVVVREGTMVIGGTEERVTVNNNPRVESSLLMIGGTHAELVLDNADVTQTAGKTLVAKDADGNPIKNAQGKDVTYTSSYVTAVCVGGRDGDGTLTLQNTATLQFAQTLFMGGMSYAGTLDAGNPTNAHISGSYISAEGDTLYREKAIAEGGFSNPYEWGSGNNHEKLSTATVNVESGAHLNTGIGLYAGNGTINVTGAGSVLNIGARAANADNFTLGWIGYDVPAKTTLNITEGGVVNGGVTSYNKWFDVASAANSLAEINVSGQDAATSTASQLNVECGTAYLACNTGAQASFNITDGASAVINATHSYNWKSGNNYYPSGSKVYMADSDGSSVDINVQRGSSMSITTTTTTSTYTTTEKDEEGKDVKVTHTLTAPGQMIVGTHANARVSMNVEDNSSLHLYAEDVVAVANAADALAEMKVKDHSILSIGSEGNVYIGSSAGAQVSATVEGASTLSIQAGERSSVSFGGYLSDSSVHLRAEGNSRIELGGYSAKFGGGTHDDISVILQDSTLNAPTLQLLYGSNIRLEGSSELAAQWLYLDKNAMLTIGEASRAKVDSLMGLDINGGGTLINYGTLASADGETATATLYNGSRLQTGEVLISGCEGLAAAGHDAQASYTTGLDNVALAYASVRKASTLTLGALLTGKDEMQYLSSADMQLINNTVLSGLGLAKTEDGGYVTDESGNYLAANDKYTVTFKHEVGEKITVNFTTDDLNNVSGKESIAVKGGAILVEQGEGEHHVGTIGSYTETTQETNAAIAVHEQTAGSSVTWEGSELRTVAGERTLIAADNQVQVTPDSVPESGKLTVVSTSELQVQGCITAGNITVENGASMVNNGVLYAGVTVEGTLKGSGTIAGELLVSRDGTLIVGNSPGYQIVSSAHLEDGSTTVFCIAGMEAATEGHTGWASGTASQLCITEGSLTLDANACITIEFGGDTLIIDGCNGDMQAFAVTLVQGGCEELTAGQLTALMDHTTFTLTSDAEGLTGLSQASRMGLTVTDARYEVVGANLVLRGNMTLTPEPTTATLSLLALAGLAARRRRR